MVLYMHLASIFTSGLQQSPHVAIEYAMNTIFIISFMVPTKMLLSDYWHTYLCQFFQENAERIP